MGNMPKRSLLMSKPRSTGTSKRLASTLLASSLLAASFATFSAQAEEKAIRTIATIKPLHSLIANVTKGISAPDLLIEGKGSPHNFALKPSQLKSLDEADVILWIDENLERFLERPIESLNKEKNLITAAELEGITLHQVREDDGFEAHNHDHEDEDGDKDDHDHDHGKKEEHDHEKHDDHDNHDDHDDHKKHDHADHDEADFHLWLDPENARVIVKKLSDLLGEIDPKNKQAYEKNTDDFIAKLNEADAEIKDELAGLGDKKFIVFHDAYQYFEARYGLKASGSITLSPELPTNAARIKALQKRLKDDHVKCVFSEPQFNPKSVAILTEGTDIKVAQLDPLGVAIEKGEGHYIALLKKMAQDFKACLQ